MSLVPDPRVSANLLLVEIGNSHLTLAHAIGDTITELQRFESGSGGSIIDAVVEAWNNLPSEMLSVMLIASVVPQAQERLIAELESRIDAEPMVLGVQIPVPLETEQVDRASVGIDRICNAFAAYDEVKEACVVASFGTAITIDCVDGNGVFRGGAILPGMNLQARALNDGTARLPLVEILAPVNTYGLNTENAITNGVVYGVSGALREIVERYATDLTSWPRLIITGGQAGIIRETCDFVDVVVPNLILRGMVASYRAFYADEPEEEQE